MHVKLMEQQDGGVRHFGDVPCYRKLRRYFNKIPLTISLAIGDFLNRMND